MAEGGEPMSRLSLMPESFRLVQSEKLTFIKNLGRGGFGFVTLQRHRHWGKVAVKQVVKKTDITQEMRDAFYNEAKKMLDVITSPYIVSVMGMLDVPDGGISIIMEYLEYGSLRHFTPLYLVAKDQGPTPSDDHVFRSDCWERRIRMICDMIMGMNFLHTSLAQPIFHRDLKLENVFVGNGFRVKIGDLGLAVSRTSRSQASQMGEKGTITHIPPEILTNKETKATEAWDRYSFGITLFEFVALTTENGNDIPYPGFANEGLLKAWARKNVPPNDDNILPDTPDILKDTIKECCDADPAKRPSFQDMQHKFISLYEERYESTRIAADAQILLRIHIHETEESNRVSEPTGLTPTPPGPIHAIHNNTPEGVDRNRTRDRAVQNESADHRKSADCHKSEGHAYGSDSTSKRSSHIQPKTREGGDATIPGRNASGGDPSSAASDDERTDSITLADARTSEAGADNTVPANEAQQEATSPSQIGSLKSIEQASGLTKTSAEQQLQPGAVSVWCRERQGDATTRFSSTSSKPLQATADNNGAHLVIDVPKGGQSRDDVQKLVEEIRKPFEGMNIHGNPSTAIYKHHMADTRCLQGRTEATDRHCQDVITKLGPDELQRLYHALGINHIEVQEAEASASGRNVDVKARSVLRYWKILKEADATCETLLVALILCNNIQAKEELLDEWHLRDFSDHIPPEPNSSYINLGRINCRDDTAAVTAVPMQEMRQGAAPTSRVLVTSASTSNLYHEPNPKTHKPKRSLTVPTSNQRSKSLSPKVNRNFSDHIPPEPNSSYINLGRINCRDDTAAVTAVPMQEMRQGAAPPSRVLVTSASTSNLYHEPNPKTHKPKRSLTVPTSNQRSKSLSPKVNRRPLSPSSADRNITEKDIQRIDTHIGKRYPQLGRALGLKDVDISTVCHDYQSFGTDEVVHQMLAKWIGRYGSKAKKSVLIRALQKADLADLCYKIP